MMTADEARKIATDEDKTISKQFEEIEKYIGEAAFNGNFSVYVAGTLHPYVKKYLENIGYKVDTGGQWDNAFYSISWVQ